MDIVRANQDKAGGIVIEGSSNVFVNGKPMSFINAKIQPHGSSPHNSARISQGSKTVFVNGKAVARSGDKATCGHPCTGSDNVGAG